MKKYSLTNENRPPLYFSTAVRIIGMLAFACVSEAMVAAQDGSKDLGTTPIEIDIVNDAKSEVQIVWVDTQGTEHPISSVAVNARAVVTTYEGHLHYFKIGSRTIGRHVATVEARQSYTIRENGVPPSSTRPAETGSNASKQNAKQVTTLKVIEEP